MKQFQKLVLIALVFVMFSHKTLAQNNLGHNTDNYSGVYSLSYNPAEIVDSRFKFHMNIIGVGFTTSNNYIGIKRKALFSDRSTAFNDPNFTDNYLVERLNGKNKGVYVSADIMAPLSFMANFGKKRSHAIGFNSRIRFQTNVNGAAENLATMSYNEILITDLYNVGIQNKNFSIQTNAWAEYGLTYGTDIINTGKHYVSAAGTFKLTQGLANAYFYSDNMNVTFPSDSTVSVDNSDLRFGYSSILGTNMSNYNTSTIIGGKLGFGMDLGAVWEFRPNADKYKYEMNGDPDYLDPRKEKYKLKVGLGLMDMGFSSYNRDNGVFGEYYADRPDIDIDETFGAAFEDFGNTGLQNFQDTLASIFVEKQAKKESYNVSLPMKINVYADYNIWKGFYANLGASIAPAFKKNPEKTRGISEFSITPRFEHKWFSFYLPVSVNTHGNSHLGTGMRIGPLAFGTNDILPLMGKKTIYDANVYMNLSIPITKKIRDKDKDHVSNKMDDCKRELGTWETKGCPDNDQDDDGVLDGEDDCPEIAGSKELNGCPDTDKDGIADKEDACPDVAGLKAFNGCPDTDEDGFQDSEDDCPEVAGIEAFKGCPDTDGDGLKDSEDSCPEVAGPAENNGCPFEDDDKDGVLNKDDDCPQTPGPKENRGCPIIEKEVEEALDLAFKNLEFESGKAIIKQASYASLETLSTILKAHPDYTLLIEGHTDNVGNDANNLLLSQKRADAIKLLLVSKGVQASTIETKFYGKEKPITTNDTPEGRQQNRRVELTITFK
jgi:outer membrane protein OmpA-like peptidoglycan-associated protein